MTRLLYLGQAWVRQYGDAYLRSSVRRLKSWRPSLSSWSASSRKDKDLSSLAVPRLADQSADLDLPDKEWPEALWLSKALIPTLVANNSVSKTLRTDWIGPTTRSEWRGGLYMSRVLYWTWKAASSTTAGRKYTVKISASIQWHDPENEDLRSVCSCTCPGYRSLIGKDKCCQHVGAVLAEIEDHQAKTIVQPLRAALEDRQSPGKSKDSPVFL